MWLNFNSAKGCFILFLLILSAEIVKGQQFPLLANYEYNKNLINPSAIALEEFNFSMIYRNQWRGFAGAPKLSGLNLSKSKRKTGFGIYLMNDEAGAFKQTVVHLNYMYNVFIIKKTVLAFGIAGGVDIYALNQNKLKLEESQDPFLEQYANNFVLPDANFGISIFNLKSLKAKYYYSFGVSIQHIIENDYLQKHFNIDGSFKHKLINSKKKLDIEWNFLVKYVTKSPLLFDLGGKIIYENLMWAGVSYRTSNDIISRIGVIKNNLQFGYSFGYSYKGIKSSNSHEIFISFRKINKTNSPSIKF